MDKIKRMLHSPQNSPPTSPRQSQDNSEFQPHSSRSVPQTANAYSVPNTQTNTQSAGLQSQQDNPARRSSLTGLPFPQKDSAPTIPAKSQRDTPLDMRQSAQGNTAGMERRGSKGMTSSPNHVSSGVVPQNAAGHPSQQTATSSLEKGVENLGLGSALPETVSEQATHDHKTLAPVVHEKKHFHETEIVERVRNVDRHVHHVQHHVQPLIESFPAVAVHYDQNQPTKYIHEQKVNSPQDAEFWAMLNSFKHTETQICEERVVIDKGERVVQTVHYHVHNIIQPVIYRDRPIPTECMIQPRNVAAATVRPVQAGKERI